MQIFKRLAVVAGSGIAAATAIGFTAAPAYANVACTPQYSPGGISPVWASACADARFYNPNPFSGAGLGAQAAASTYVTIYNGTAHVCVGYTGAGVYASGLNITPDYSVGTPQAC